MNSLAKPGRAEWATWDLLRAFRACFVYASCCWGVGGGVPSSLGRYVVAFSGRFHFGFWIGGEVVERGAGVLVFGVVYPG